MRGRNYCWVLFFLILSGHAFSSTLITYVATYGGATTSPRSSAATACAALKGIGGLFPNYTPGGATGSGTGGACYWLTASQTVVYYGTWSSTTTNCPNGDNGTTCNISCDSPNTMVNGQCVMPSCPVGQKRNAGGQCEAVTCTQDSSGDEVVYSPKQSKCTKNYNLDAEEYCTYSGQKKTPTIQPFALITNDPDGLTQGVDNFKCGIDVATKDCATNNDGTHRCIVTGTSNGTYYPNATDNNVPNCPAQNCTTKPPETPKPEVPKPETSTDSKPCNYASVNGALECVSSSIENKEGTKNCGTFNGAWQCVKVPPTSNGISILTKVTTEATPDGGTKTTKTDTATQTKCTDIGKCTTSTTTNVNVTIKDGQGNVTSTTGTCKGDNCPDKNGNPDANGDGFGDCVGDDCGGGSGGPSNAELEEVPTFGQTTQSLISRVKSSNVAQSLTGITVPSSGVCPTYSVETHIATVEYESHCEIVEPKRDLIKVIMRAVWAFVAILFFFGG